MYSHNKKGGNSEKQKTGLDNITNVVIRGNLFSFSLVFSNKPCNPAQKDGKGSEGTQAGQDGLLLAAMRGGHCGRRAMYMHTK